MNEAGAIIKDHWPYLVAGVGFLVLLAMLATVGLIFFIKWAVHIEFTTLTGTLHQDISDINAKLALLAKTNWTDLALARKFADVDTVARSTVDCLTESQKTIQVLEDEQNSLRAKIKDHDERLRVVETWKGKISDMSIIRGGF